jgi:hypothetical protein
MQFILHEMLPLRPEARVLALIGIVPSLAKGGGEGFVTHVRGNSQYVIIFLLVIKIKRQARIQYLLKKMCS